VVTLLGTTRDGIAQEGIHVQICFLIVLFA